MIPNQLFLESQLKTAEQEYDAQAALCIQSQQSSSAVIGRQLKEKEDQLQSLQSQHQTLGDNLYLHLSKVLNVDELEKLNKVLSQRVMQLPPSQYSFDINQLRHMLNCESSEQLSLSGLKLSIEELIPQHVQKTGQELVEEIGDVNKQITELKQLLEVSRESEAAERKKERIKSSSKTV